MTKKADHSSKFRVFFEYICLLLVVIIPLSVQAGLFGNGSSTSNLVFDNYQADLNMDGLVLSSSQNPAAGTEGRGGADVMVNDGVLVSGGPVGPDVIALNRVSSGEISIYTVRAGDTLSHIADMYGVTVNTILWANDLTRATSIREGQTLVILPIAGVRHIIKKGDTLSSLVKKYDGNADEIMSYNQLASADGLEVGSVIVIPGGSIYSAPVASASPVRVTGGGGAVTAVSGWTHPAPGAIKTQGIHGYNAVDLAGSVGTPIRAASAGEVIISKSSGWNGGYGQYIVIRHANGVQTLYAHLSRNHVGVGSVVSQGQEIGSMGNTGRSTGPHLHFEVRGAKNPF